MNVASNSRFNMNMMYVNIKCPHYMDPQSITTLLNSVMIVLFVSWFMSAKHYSWFPTTRWFYDLHKILLIFLLYYPSPNSLSRKIMHSTFKIEVFNALQMWFNPSKYASLKTTLQNATPNWKWRRHLKSFV
jgi:hypothetical protein